MKILKNLGLLFLSIGLGLFIIDLYVVGRTRSFLEESTVTDGTVLRLVERSSSSGSTSTMYRPVVEFLDENGQLHEFESTFGSAPPKYKAGDRVRVRYSPSKPQSARIDGFVGNWLAVIVLSSLGFGFAAAGTILYGIQFNVKSRRSHLTNYGTTVSTEIISITIDHHTTLNGKHPWRITSQWINPNTNKVCQFRSAALLEDPTPLIHSNRIKVMVDLKNPKNYEMDLSLLPSHTISTI